MRGSPWHLGQSVTCRLTQADKKAMVPFAGWSMPIQYKDSIMDSTLVIADVAGLAPGTGTLTVFTNEKGGAVDDSVITKVKDDHIYLVVNAGCRDKDLAHIEEHMKAFKSKKGPLAAPVLQHLTKDDLGKLYFGEFRILDINGATCFLTRTGYTLEDGFEISVPSENAVDLAKAILERSEGKAGLNWAIGKRRAEGGFLGAQVIRKQLEEGPSIRRAGFTSPGPPPRSHTEIQDEKGNNIGEITSGGFSPCLKKNIAMGYVKSGLHKAGTKAKILVRGKAYDGVVTKTPFVPTKYYKPS
ncbi:Aminomethyltransferase [Hibiscus syriacus]|uniref:aminomethyltransferase n=1 Tax=Hibiscus syriacus TaxID=106335 RepID=A0A6A3C1I6_HIBSY|nr:Aminomethyltransferase [Hibiscus syriacus]KAE8721062.1 Aminomethyltransferase [Hibiscus syriacus]